MLANVKTLIIILIVLFINIGCSSKEYVNVPQKCSIPEVEEPIVDNSSNKDIFEAMKKCTFNYTLVKEYAEQLKNNLEICK